MSSFSRFGLLTAVAMTALLAGCKHHQQDTSAPGERAKAPSGSTLGIAGQMLDGADQATIRTYLQTVQDVKPKKFSVQWSPDTVPVSRDEAMRSLDPNRAPKYIVFAEGTEDEMCFGTYAIVPDNP